MHWGRSETWSALFLFSVWSLDIQLSHARIERRDALRAFIREGNPLLDMPPPVPFKGRTERLLLHSDRA